MLAKAGYAKIEDVPVVDMELSTADGETLTVEREEGEPQVGDVASPDGEFVMPRWIYYHCCRGCDYRDQAGGRRNGE